MESINVIGLMTGTSCDGMDLSLVNCKKNNNSIDGKTIKNHYVKYPVSLTKKLLQSYISSPPELAKTHMQLGQFWSEKISEWIKENFKGEAIPTVWPSRSMNSKIIPNNTQNGA